jgi:hypothetical protein
VQTSDTGQTAASALTYPTAAYQVRGYQIWRMADTLASTVPVYVKLEFGNGNTTSSYNVWFTVGTGSNGAGVITGTLIARTADLIVTATVAGIFAGSADTGRLAFFIGGAGQGHALFSIERTKDATGADTSDGLLVVIDNGAVGSAPQHYRLLRFVGTAPPNSTVWGVSVPSGTTYALGANVGVSPVRFFDGQPTNPCLNFMAYLNADIAVLSSVPVAVYGTSHTYFTIGSSHVSTLGTANNLATLMIRYE